MIVYLVATAIAAFADFLISAANVIHARGDYPEPRGRVGYHLMAGLFGWLVLLGVALVYRGDVKASIGSLRGVLFLTAVLSIAEAWRFLRIRRRQRQQMRFRQTVA